MLLKTNVSQTAAKTEIVVIVIGDRSPESKRKGFSSRILSQVGGKKNLSEWALMSEANSALYKDFKMIQSIVAEIAKLFVRVVAVESSHNFIRIVQAMTSCLEGILNRFVAQDISVHQKVLRVTAAGEVYLINGFLSDEIFGPCFMHFENSCEKAHQIETKTYMDKNAEAVRLVAANCDETPKTSFSFFPLMDGPCDLEEEENATEGLQPSTAPQPQNSEEDGEERNDSSSEKDEKDQSKDRSAKENKSEQKDSSHQPSEVEKQHAMPPNCLNFIGIPVLYSSKQTQSAGKHRLIVVPVINDANTDLIRFYLSLVEDSGFSHALVVKYKYYDYSRQSAFSPSQIVRAFVEIGNESEQQDVHEEEMLFVPCILRKKMTFTRNEELGAQVEEVNIENEERMKIQQDLFFFFSREDLLWNKENETEKKESSSRLISPYAKRFQLWEKKQQEKRSEYFYNAVRQKTDFSTPTKWRGWPASLQNKNQNNQQTRSDFPSPLYPSDFRSIDLLDASPVSVSPLPASPLSEPSLPIYSVDSHFNFSSSNELSMFVDSNQPSFVSLSSSGVASSIKMHAKESSKQNKMQAALKLVVFLQHRASELFALPHDRFEPQSPSTPAPASDSDSRPEKDVKSSSAPIISTRTFIIIVVSSLVTISIFGFVVFASSRREENKENDETCERKRGGKIPFWKHKRTTIPLISSHSLSNVHQRTMTPPQQQSRFERKDGWSPAVIVKKNDVNLWHLQRFSDSSSSSCVCTEDFGVKRKRIYRDSRDNGLSFESGNITTASSRSLWSSSQRDSAEKDKSSFPLEQVGGFEVKRFIPSSLARASSLHYNSNTAQHETLIHQAGGSKLSRSLKLSSVQQPLQHSNNSNITYATTTTKATQNSASAAAATRAPLIQSDLHQNLHPPGNLSSSQGLETQTTSSSSANSVRPLKSAKNGQDSLLNGVALLSQNSLERRSLQIRSLASVVNEEDEEDDEKEFLVGLQMPADEMKAGYLQMKSQREYTAAHHVKDISNHTHPFHSLNATPRASQQQQRVLFFQQSQPLHQQQPWQPSQSLRDQFLREFEQFDFARQARILEGQYSSSFASNFNHSAIEDHHQQYAAHQAEPSEQCIMLLLQQQMAQSGQRYAAPKNGHPPVKGSSTPANIDKSSQNHGN
eukprot:GDKJ01010440.1.p1 GENE.GDKJ01010440.1~~GDKJ01010440.1.p1  ORF type:complete len:1153 (+),score=338.98 GDKJ01010440.1:1913-5371(+)